MTIKDSNTSVDDQVDVEIANYLDLKNPRSFFLFAGAGSGKTRSLTLALEHIRHNYGKDLTQHGHRVGVITYTNAACDEIDRRIGFDPLFYITTIHSFCWELICNFSRDIREWLRENLQTDISTLREEERNGRPGTKASTIRQIQIESKQKRLERLDSIYHFSYSPSGENKAPNSLNHSEVIEICAHFISEKPLMRWILSGRFPFLLIDECQDTNKRLIDALFITAAENPKQFSLGLIGDLMQRIYADGKERLEQEIPDSWGKPSKRLNHRCPKRIVQLINKIREEADTHSQEPRSDATDGHVRIFIRPINVNSRTETESIIRSQMASITSDEGWNTPDHCKTLTLEHHMSAKRLGFENIFNSLYQIENWRTGLLDGHLPIIRFYAESVLPLIECQKTNDRFSVAKIMREKSPLITPQTLKESQDPTLLLQQARSGILALESLWEKSEPTCGEVLLCINKHNLLSIPDVLQPIVAILKSSKISNEDEDPIDEQTKALSAFMMAPFSEIGTYRKYISGQASFDTHQGVKGLEFERVMVIVDDSEAKGFMFGYGKLFGDKELSKADIKNIGEGKESSIDRTRRLLYVTCSRARKSLALVVYSENPEAIKANMIRRGWFHENEIDVIN